jgi:hypothetical protein
MTSRPWHFNKVEVKIFFHSWISMCSYLIRNMKLCFWLTPSRALLDYSQRVLRSHCPCKHSDKLLTCYIFHEFYTIWVIDMEKLDGSKKSSRWFAWRNSTLIGHNLSLIYIKLLYFYITLCWLLILNIRMNIVMLLNVKMFHFLLGL